MSPFLDVPQKPGSLKQRLKEDDDDQDDIIDGLSMIEEGKTESPFLGPNSVLRSATASPFSQDGRLLSPVVRFRALSPAPPQYPQTWKASVIQGSSRFWNRNRGVILVACAQLFGALMNLAARLLELEGEGMHPFQILFARMSLTTILSCIYMYWKKVPHFPFGAKEVRWLLVARGITGFFGIFPFWLSMMYLPLAEATVISFLAPSVSGYICHLVLKDPFTRREQIASFIALAGVVLIARPASLFSSSDSESVVAATPGIESSVPMPGNATTQQHTMPHLGDEPTPAERVWAIGVGLIGVCGAAGAFTFIRWIGKRAHPLISVNYFSVWCTIVSTTSLLLAPVFNIGQPAIRFGLPSSVHQWFLLLSLGLCGFIMQFMLTSGLGGEKSNRATAMVYTHMLFAAGFDRWVFGHEMGFVSLVGCGLIVGSALWAVLSKKEPVKKSTTADADMEDVLTGTGMGVERVPMLGEQGVEEEEEEEEEGAIPLGRVG
ncbi:hypothetical protein B0H66DRAFT_563525 [Apodospora peruviana]|uniref:EamA domain-containing protein n=1 Tax=Apodospora peruviana TaxID=516989 RepID=A0AAE0HZD5_9PEZI|nr:hypothetical protein B0H66DRAFT_563525 [Apodospora peruviana]